MRTNTIIHIISGVIITLITYYGTNKMNESSTDQVIGTFTSVIQWQAKMMEKCK